MLTKADEKAMLTELIHGLPEGYVRSILEAQHMEMERAIDSDFAFVDLAMYRRLQAEADTYLREKQKQANELLQQIEDLTRTKRLLLEGLAETRGIIRRLSHI